MSELRPPHVIQPGARTPQPPQAPKPQEDNEPIGLVEDAPNQNNQVISPSSKIKLMQGASHTTHTYKRPTAVTGQGAVRVRTFHGRLSDEGMAYLDDKINEWLDQHADIEVKFVTTNIGQFEGKIRELALIVSVWY